MNTNPRQLQLLEEVRARKSATVEQLADTLGVTLQTVRRDVQRLAESGLLTRFHGGVRVPSSTVENLAHTQRETLHADGKARIARAVAEQVPNDCSLILNIGTTTEAIAKALLHHRGLRVITNNLNVAAILSSNPECEVIVAGGVVRARDRGIVGEAAVDFIRQFKLDLALIGISPIEPDGSQRTVRVAFAATNEQPYRSIQQWLIGQGATRVSRWPDDTKAWVAQNPQRVPQLMWSNPRYVFFREEALNEVDAAFGPRGAQGVPLTAGRSIAVDRESIPYGTPVWLASPGPTVALQKLVVAQDTGSAIVGAVRADYFAGTGPEAGRLAATVNQPLRLWALWPRQASAP